MTIVELLKSGSCFRIEFCERWLYWSGEKETWMVSCHRYKSKYRRTLIETASEEEAVAALLKEE